MNFNHQMLSFKVVLIFIVSLTVQNITSAKCVYLQPLSIKAIDMGNMLSWTTTQEEDLQMFVIQKSTNGIDFKRVGDVKGSGFSNKNQAYRFVDLALPEAKTYYRLLHYATDGSFTISETFFIGQSLSNEWTVSSVSSTIANHDLDLNLNTKKATTIDYVVKNKNGRTVKTGQQDLAKGSNVVSINCKAFANGEYNVTLQSPRSKADITIKKVNQNDMPPLEYAVNR